MLWIMIKPSFNYYFYNYCQNSLGDAFAPSKGIQSQDYLSSLLNSQEEQSIRECWF